MTYSYEQFEADAAALKPRAFDTWVLPAFMMYFAVRSKGGAGKNMRRILFTSGCYMALRNLKLYRESIAMLRERVTDVAAIPEIIQEAVS